MNIASSRKNDRVYPQTAPYERPANGGRGTGQTVPLFSEEELGRFLAGGFEIAPETPEVSIEARSLARTLGAQYVEVIAHYAVDALMGRTSKHAPKLRTVVKDSRRLATEMNDGELLALYDELSELIDAFSSAAAGEARMLASRKLRDWVMRFADMVGDEAGQKLRKVVVFRKGVHPLISHLREVRGIGERRLERLYGAGLLTTEALMDAEPHELAQVVGVPLRLARQVVTACRHFMEQQRLAHVKSLKTVVTDITKDLRHIDRNDDAHVRLVAAVRETIAGLNEALTELEESWRRDHGA